MFAGSMPSAMTMTLAVTVALAAGCNTAPATPTETFAASAAARASLAAQAEYFGEIAAAMPEAGYAFAPADDVRTFAGQLLHAANGLVSMSDALVGATTVMTTDASGMSKETIVAELADAFAHVDRVLADVPDSALDDQVPWQSRMLDAQTISKRQVLAVLRDHLAHHRGQAVVYLRLQGVVPPTYVGF